MCPPRKKVLSAYKLFYKELNPKPYSLAPNVWTSNGLIVVVKVLFKHSLMHKFKHNFRETLNPLCAINDGVEDTEHYFLLCHAYDVFRHALLSSVNVILLPYGIICPSNEELLKVILYGHEQ